MAEDLAAWYATNARDLPWRQTTDPYAILVSEVMLQQTQVARVVPRFRAWLDRWPTAATLATAPQPDVLAAWVGLGYNRRAIRLRAACSVVARDGWPTTVAGLRELPGVGPYTAAAVAAFAYGTPVAAVDTNVRRVGERLEVSPQAVVDAAQPAPQLAPGIESRVVRCSRGSRDPRRPGGRGGATVAAALMELGALVCRARRPDCGACPLVARCPSAHAVTIAERAPAGSRVRLEETNRWARGRVIAALAAGDGLPSDVPADRLDRAVDGLVADGLLERQGTAVRLAR